MSNRKNTNKNEYYMEKTRTRKSSRKQELDAPECHKEIFKNSLVRMFLVFIILAIQNICAIVEANAVEDILKTVLFEENGISWTVKLRGALCPIMLYVCDKNNHIYNIRFNSSEIDAYYIMSDKKNNNQYTRDPTKDTVHKKDINGDVLTQFDIDYYTTLISMFPSPKQKISIFPEEDCKDSFTLFLKSEPVKKHAHMILASLLLLSEGIKVPLFFDKTPGSSQRLVLRKVGQEKRKEEEKEEEEHFSLEMVIDMPQIEKGNGCGGQKLDTYQKKAVEVIEFFIHYASDYCKVKYSWPGMKPTAAVSGPFQFYERIEWLDRLMKTPYWLIQTYIHFFLETVEEANSFNRTVYLMLDEHIIESRRNNLVLEERKERRLFDDLFSNDHNELKEMLRYWKKIQKLKSLVKPPEKIQLLPFTKHSELPIKKVVNLDIFEKVQLKTEIALDEIEAALLGIFSCLTYDPNSNSYETDHIPNLHVGIKSFFSMPADCISYVLNRACGINVRPDNNKPIKKGSFNMAVGKEVTQEIYCQWKKIVRNIMKDREKDGYEIDQKIAVYGIINLISIVLALAGKSKEEMKEMLGISISSIDGISGENNISPFSNIFESLFEKKISTALASLSRNCIAGKNLDTWYENNSSFEEGREVFILFEVHEAACECNDFYGTLKIYYAYKRQAQPMIIYLRSEDTAALELGSPIIKLDKGVEEEVRYLKRDIINMQRLAFPYFILSDYAVHIELYTLCDYIIINSGYIKLVNKTAYSTLDLIYPKVQPFQYEVEYTTDKHNIIIFMMWDHRFAPVHTYYNLRYINNILANQQAPSMEIRKYLIICIGCRVNNIKENLSKVQGIRNETWEVHRLVCIKDMVKIINNLLLVGSDLDVANAIATYAQILSYIYEKNATELLERLSREGRNKAIECLKKYCDISDKTTA
ncbi:hypothetical protein NEAUS06_0716 [Nematocida ausubeli]|nr:hypothetical protein NEAUS06_0716 [Nematocida ausubeli]